MNAVSFTSVTKEFLREDGGKLRAVDDLSLEVQKGEVFSIVGPDGAGKTTAIRMMCGVLAPTSGIVEVLGLNVQRQRAEIKKHIGYLSQRFSLYSDLTVDENIDFFAEIHGMKGFGQRKEELLEMTRLTSFRDRLSGRLSGGMKQKLALACTLIHTPEVIFLDEPTTGVDPVSRRDFWRILSGLLKAGMTIVVSTPYLDEAERSSRVALMSGGRILQCDTPSAVKSSFPSDVFEIVIGNVREAADRLREKFGPNRVQLFGDRLHLHWERGSSESPHKALEEMGLRPESLRALAPSLEDVFILATQTKED